MKEIVIYGNKDTRSGFGEGLAELARKNKKVVGLCADLTGSLKMNAFKDENPDRFFQVGIAEANMIGIAAGMAVGGMIPYTGTFANFSTARVYDQIRQSVAYSKKNVKICASHAGLTLGEDGATHQTLEDVGMMRMLPNMTVIVPADFNQTKQATIAVAAHDGPVYLRFGRPVMPIFTAPEREFVIGKADIISEGSDLTIISCGHMVWKSIEAAKELSEKGVSVELINMHTIKPLDENAILKSLSKTGCVVTAEEHMMNGGLGDAVAQVLSKNNPCPHEYVAVNDTFGESGKPMELMAKYGIDTADIINAANKAMSRK